MVAVATEGVVLTGVVLGAEAGEIVTAVAATHTAIGGVVSGVTGGALGWASTILIGAAAPMALVGGAILVVGASEVSEPVVQSIGEMPLGDSFDI